MYSVLLANVAPPNTTATPEQQVVHVHQTTQQPIVFICKAFGNSIPVVSLYKTQFMCMMSCSLFRLVSVPGVNRDMQTK